MLHCKLQSTAGTLELDPGADRPLSLRSKRVEAQLKELDVKMETKRQELVTLQTELQAQKAKEAQAMGAPA